MRKALVIAAVTVLATAGWASAQVAGTPHDLGTGAVGTKVKITGAAPDPINSQTCIFCHTPHGGQTKAPLWNRTLSSATYTLYSSDTLDSSPTQPVRAATTTCLSCHDGSVALDALLNVAGSTSFSGTGILTVTGGLAGNYTSKKLTGGPAALGTDFSNDHPIAIIYSTSGTGLVAGNFATANKPKVGTLPLYGAGSADATVECGSCHDPHNNANTNFLRMSNNGSALCITCHIK